MRKLGDPQLAAEIEAELAGQCDWHDEGFLRRDAEEGGTLDPGGGGAQEPEQGPDPERAAHAVAEGGAEHAEQGEAEPAGIRGE